MQRYRAGSVINDGGFATVYQAFSESGDLVAVKRLKHKFRRWQECMELREVKALKKLSHPNIVKLREVIREGEDLYLIFDFCERSIYTILKSLTKPLNEEHIRLIMHQVLSGLAYCHKNGLMHRDIKPENLFCNALDSVRIGDFALCKEVSGNQLTDYVSTRWYRSPEILERSDYGPSVDLWAAGTVMAELFLMRPLFPGSSEGDQLSRIEAVVPREGAPNISQHVPTASPGACALMSQLLSWRSRDRPSASEALEHPFFHVS